MVSMTMVPTRVVFVHFGLQTPCLLQVLALSLPTCVLACGNLVVFLFKHNSHEHSHCIRCVPTYFWTFSHNVSALVGLYLAWPPIAFHYLWHILFRLSSFWMWFQFVHHMFSAFYKNPAFCSCFNCGHWMPGEETAQRLINCTPVLASSNALLQCMKASSLPTQLLGCSIHRKHWLHAISPHNTGLGCSCLMQASALPFCFFVAHVSHEWDMALFPTNQLAGMGPSWSSVTLPLVTVWIIGPFILLSSIVDFVQLRSASCTTQPYIMTAHFLLFASSLFTNKTWAVCALGVDLIRLIC